MGDSLRTLAQHLRDRTIRAEDLLERAIESYMASEKVLSAFKTWRPDLALTQAKAADALFAAGIDLGPLQGIPVSVKDVYGLQGLPTYAGAKRELPAAFSTEGSVIRALKRNVPATA